jgi:hypothetical protein
VTRCGQDHSNAQLTLSALRAMAHRPLGRRDVSDQQKPIKREGTRFVTAVPAGSRIAHLSDGSLVIAHPNHAPRVIPAKDLER